MSDDSVAQKETLQESIKTNPGSRIRLYRFLAIAFSSTLFIKHIKRQCSGTDLILTSKRNALSKTLHNLLHGHHTCAKGGLSWFLFASHLITYWKFGSIFKKIQNWDGLTILKVAPCAHDTNVFAMKFRKSLWKLFYKHELIKCFEKKQKWKASRSNNDNDIGAFAMLKYGRNEKMMLYVFICHERRKLFWGIIIFIRRVPPSNFLANLLTKGLFLTSTTQTLPTFNGGNCSFDGFYIRLHASSRNSLRNRFVYYGCV